MFLEVAQSSILHLRLQFPGQLQHRGQFSGGRQGVVLLDGIQVLIVDAEGVELDGGDELVDADEKIPEALPLLGQGALLQEFQVVHADLRFSVFGVNQRQSQNPLLSSHSKLGRAYNMAVAAAKMPAYQARRRCMILSRSIMTRIGHLCPGSRWTWQGQFSCWPTRPSRFLSLPSWSLRRPLICTSSRSISAPRRPLRRSSSSGIFSKSRGGSPSNRDDLAMPLSPPLSAPDAGSSSARLGGDFRLNQSFPIPCFLPSPWLERRGKCNDGYAGPISPSRFSSWPLPR